MIRSYCATLTSCHVTTLTSCNIICGCSGVSIDDRPPDLLTLLS